MLNDIKIGYTFKSKTKLYIIRTAVSIMSRACSQCQQQQQVICTQRDLEWQESDRNSWQSPRDWMSVSGAVNVRTRDKQIEGALQRIERQEHLLQWQTFFYLPLQHYYIGVSREVDIVQYLLSVANYSCTTLTAVAAGVILSSERDWRHHLLWMPRRRPSFCHAPLVSCNEWLIKRRRRPHTGPAVNTVEETSCLIFILRTFLL